MEKGKIFLILYDTLNYAEEKIRENSKNYIFFSFVKKTKKSEINNEALFKEILRILNKKLFSPQEDIVLKNTENLSEQEWSDLLEILSLKSANFYILLKEEKNLEIIKNLLRKSNLKYEFLDLRIKGYNQIRKIISEEIKKLGIRTNKDFLEILAENYKNNLEAFFQDLKKLSIYLDKGNNYSWEELKNFFQAATDEFKIQESFLSLNFPLFLSRFKKYINSLNSLPYQERKNRINFLISNLLFGALIKIYLLKVNPNMKIEGHPFYLSKLKEASVKLDLQTIKNLLRTLALVDKKINKFYLNYKDIPEEIVISFLLLQKLY